MDTLNKLIHDAEHKWLNSLSSVCHELLQDQNLPSHDHRHHFRVWIFIKELLHFLDTYSEIKFDYHFIEGLIIAAFFHDTGMRGNRGVKHGKISRGLCEKYFSENNVITPLLYQQILDAIEHHDDKEYKDKKDVVLSKPTLLTILNAADDLDAFGYTGIVRYAEIYLLRGILVKELKENVILNAQKRFDHFASAFSNFPSMVEKYRKKFDILIGFYQSLYKNEKNILIINNIKENLAKGTCDELSQLIEPVIPGLTEFKESLKNESEFRYPIT